jgi:RalA-binding protein 1
MTSNESSRLLAHHLDAARDHRAHTVSLPARVPTSPLALIEPSSNRSTITAPAVSSPQLQQQPSSPSANRNAQVHGREIIVDSTPYFLDRVRVPNPAKRAAPDPRLDEIREAAAADALKEEIAEKGAAASQAQAHSRPIATLRTTSEPFLSGVSLTSSPPSSPSMSTSSRPSRQEPPATMPRTTSIDSTVSSISSASQRTPGASSYRISESAGSQDIASLIAAAGSPEAVIQKLLSDKSSAASHNAQLWRLVEKQRAMILGLNRDLEKSMKEKDRYRRKLKESLVQSSSAPTLTTSGQPLDDIVARDNSQSPALSEQKRSAMSQSVLRDGSLDSPKDSEPSERTASYLSRSDTPLDAGRLQSPINPSGARSATGVNMTNGKLDQADNVTTSHHAVPGVSETTAPLAQIVANTRSPPVSPRTPDLSHRGHHPSLSISSATSPPGTAASFSGAFKGASRKAPPAPLNLSPKPKDAMPTNLVDVSESEYEEEPEKIRANRVIRGRRKTREDDDRERETLAREEEEHRSKSKKSKQSKSKSKSLPPKEAPAVALEMELPQMAQSHAVNVSTGSREHVPTYQPSGDPAAILSQRAVAEQPGILQRHVTAPSLMSPGLPMSPRPGDRPPNSPMPRAPNKALSSMPLSPRAGTAGLPLSPRPPRQPIPMPPQTPMAFVPPHLARPEAYQAYQTYQHATQASQSSIGSQPNSTPDPSPEHERPSISSDMRLPGEVYKGLVVEQFPELLLPPNALPSIFVKTASSRMRPSRQSYMAPKHFEENPVFTLAVHARSDGKQLWRVEKTYAAMVALGQGVRSATTFLERLPDRSLFSGHAPSKIDARRQALDSFFERMLDAIQDEKAALIVCKFLSAEAFESESSEYFPAARERRPDTPVGKGRTRREGYLTKRGKNFGGWKARYFVLDGPNLKYFEAPGGAQLGSIKLQNAQIGKQSPTANNNAADDEENQFRHAFLILEPKRKDSSSLVRHVLCAESDGERDQWVDALRQYVDWRDDGEEFGRGVPISKADISAPRSPKMSRSFNELRPSSLGPDASRLKYLDPMRSVGYESTVAGEAPVMGPPSTRVSDTPSPPYDVAQHSGASSGTSEQSFPQHPTISGPSNAQIIQNSNQWGMRPPPTPSFQKDKKRGLFGFRGRSSSDLGPEKATPPGSNPDNGIRAAFGVPLAESIEAAQAVGVNTELPAVMYRCIEYLTFKDAIAEEGIFRLSGSNTVIKALRDRFNTEGDVDLVEDQKNYDIHAVASLLKLYLRELPASILTRELHLEFLHCLELNAKDRLIKLNVLVNRLPRPNRVLLQALSEFLLSIVNNADVNKMNVRNGKPPLKSYTTSFIC